MKPINYDVLVDNLEQMINIMEYDSMRSAGKAKLNSQQLESMYANLERYKSKQKAAPKKTPAKEG